MSFNNGPTVITNGLVLALDAGDRNSYNSGSLTWFDLTGTNNGTLTNGPIYNSSNGGNIVFDGSDDYVIRSSNYLISSTESNFSIDLWFYMTQNPIDSGYLVPGLISVNGGVGTIQYMSFGPLPNRQLKLRWFDGAQNGKTGNSVLNLNQWYNVVCAVNNNNILFYVNGIVETIYTGNNLTTRSGDDTQYSIGNAYYGKFIGKIANVKVYNKALSATEILQNYNVTKSRFGL